MKIKNRQQLLTIGALVVVGVFLADKLILTPLGHAWSERGKRIEQLRKKVADGKQLLNREQALRDRWQKMRSSTLPPNQSLAEQKLLKAFDQWAKDSGIMVTALNQQWKYDGEDYRTLQCSVEAAGNMNAVSRFLYEMEKSPNALKFDSLDISAHDAEGQQLTLGLRVSGLVLGAQEQTQ